MISDLPNDSKKILVSGSFDPIHEGHVKYFQEARKSGLQVVCLVATDDWVSAKHAPFLSRASKIEVLSQFSTIDFVISDELKLEDAIRAIRPTLLAKGLDWKGKLPKEEFEMCQQLGVEIVYFDTITNSSSNLLSIFKNNISHDLSDLEETIANQEISTSEIYDSNYFTDPWRHAGVTYSLDDRRQIEGKNPTLIKEVFSPRNVLDAGCGPGALVYFLKELGINVSGIDFSSDAITAAPEFIKGDVQVGNISEINFADNNFDLVICREVLEHIPIKAYPAIISELARVTSRFIYITTRFNPNPRHLFDISTEFDVDPTHITCAPINLVRFLCTINGLTRKPDLELKMDWLDKRRVLVYEKI
jgi:cytidyltransferase-like protein